MKKSVIIAGAIAAIMAGTAVADTTVYGRARLGVVIADDNDSTGVVNDSSRFGFKGSEDLGNGMSAIYHFELGYAANVQGGGVGNRIGLVGLKGDFGTIALGSAWNPSYNLVEGTLDPFNHFGKIGGYVLGGRSSDVVAYINKFGPADVQVALVQVPHLTATEDDQIDAIDIGVSFDAGPVKIGVGYLGYTTVNNGDSGLALSVNYKGDGFSVGAGYADGEDIGSDKITTLQGSVNVGSAGKIVAQYGSMDNADVNGTILAYHHNLSKRTQAYIETASEDAHGGDAQTIIGLKHNF